MKRSKYPATVATCVCCNMISETQTRYGVGSRCQGRSLRPSASNQRSSAGANRRARPACSVGKSAAIGLALDVAEELPRRVAQRAQRDAATDEGRHPEVGL